MGYGYDTGGRLCCDVCDRSGAKKYPCPFGYCQPLALCEKCREKKSYLVSREYHREMGCEISSKQFDEGKRKEKELMEKGRYIRASAVSEGNGKVKVTFRRFGKERTFYMDKETYHAYPLGKLCTIEDYRNKGKITEMSSQNEAVLSI